MAENSRKRYGFGDCDRDEADACPVCGCRHFEVERKIQYRNGEIVKKIVRKTCRNCGAEM